MKIKSEYLEALRQEDVQRARQLSGTGTFDDVLAMESAKKDTACVAQETPGAKSVLAPPLLAGVDCAETATEEAADATPLTGRTVMEHLDSVLDQLESYASTLKGDTAQSGLRNAYGVLEGISTQVDQLKQTLPDLPEGNAALQSVVDELEILAVTERFKFNRGDYL